VYRHILPFYKALLIEEAAMLLLLKTNIKMARIKQNQNLDNLIHAITVVSESQCSLSEEDRNILSEALNRLHDLGKKKGKTNGQILDEFVKIIGLLTRLFLENDRISNDAQ
jgi:hypothetical protein